MISGNLNFLEPCGPLQACDGTDLPLWISEQVTYRIRTEAFLDICVEVQTEVFFGGGGGWIANGTCSLYLLLLLQYVYFPLWMVTLQIKIRGADI